MDVGDFEVMCYDLKVKDYCFVGVFSLVDVVRWVGGWEVVIMEFSNFEGFGKEDGELWSVKLDSILESKFMKGKCSKFVLVGNLFLFVYEEVEEGGLDEEDIFVFEE